MTAADVLWIVLAAAIGFVVAVVGMLVLRRHRRCPSCDVPMEPLEADPDEQPRATYEILTCPRCTNASTLVHGARARFAYCPQCRQRALDAPCIRLDDEEEGRRRVEVHEHCNLCGYRFVRVVEDPPGPGRHRGRVIPFPADRSARKVDRGP